MALATRAAIVTAIFGIILFFSKRYSELLQPPFNDAVEAPKCLSLAWQPLIAAAVMMAVVTLVVGIVATLVQTRGATSVTLARRGLRERLKGFSPILIVELFLVGCVSSVAVWYLAHEVFYSLRIESTAAVSEYFSKLLLKICKLVVVVSAVLAILALFVYQIAFLVKHREKSKHN
jgi:hypothetical protein